MEKGIIEMLNKMSSFVFLLTTLIIFSNFTYGHKVSPTSTGSYYSGTKSVGSTILFTGSSSHDNDSQTLNYTPKWEWDFDYAGTFHPGSPTTSSTVTHVYQSAGVKTIAVRYTDNDNQAGNIYTFQITISGINRYYYAKDHLGNIRQTWDKNGNIAAAQDYYSYGEILRSYNASSGFENYKYTSKERDAESNLDYFGARYYESLTGRWMQVDPLADKYPGWSPYNYCLNNPLIFVDPNGDTVNISQVSGQASLLGDLSSTTGLSLTTDDNGNIIQTPNVTTTIMGTEITMNGVVVPGNTSSTATSFLEAAISSSEKVNVENPLERDGFVNEATTTKIYYNTGMIGLRLLQNISGLDTRTAGFAMAFFHELTHTNIGQEFYHSPTRLVDPRVGETGLGDVVPRMNIMRRELGSTFGQRNSYPQYQGLGVQYINSYGNTVYYDYFKR